MNDDPRQSKHKPNAQQGGEVIMVQHHNDADVMSVEQVVDCLLNPNDPNQQIPKLIYSLARQISYDPNIQEDLVQRGMLYAIERIHDKWCKPSDSGETIVSLGQMVRAITANKFVLEKQMIMESQNATSHIEIKDNYGLYEERKETRGDLNERGQYENQSYYTDTVNSDGEGSYGVSDDMFKNATGGITASGHKLYEQPEYEQLIDHKDQPQGLYQHILPKLNEAQQQLWEYKITLGLSHQEIADLLGEPNARVITSRWQRLTNRLEKLAAEYQSNKPKQLQTPKANKPQALVKTALVKAAVKHGIMSQEVERMLGDKR